MQGTASTSKLFTKKRFVNLQKAFVGEVLGNCFLESIEAGQKSSAVPLQQFLGSSAMSVIGFIDQFRSVEFESITIHMFPS